MTALSDLYAKIPAVDCIPGCTDCCGVIPLPLAAERRAFGQYNRIAPYRVVTAARPRHVTHAAAGQHVIEQRAAETGGRAKVQRHAAGDDAYDFLR